MPEFSTQWVLIDRLVVLNSGERDWALVALRKGKRGDMVRLSPGVTTIGRDQSNQIVLPDSSVSRLHAEIVCGEDGVWVRDLKSHNGIRVNGVPRQEARLQAGDRLEIGDFVFELAATRLVEAGLEVLQQTVESAARQEQTVDERVRLPEAPQDRQLATLYHVCFWVTEGVEESAFVPRCLRLLQESLRVQEVHLYSGDRQLEAVVTENRQKPAVKLAAFLAGKFQEMTEAVIILGRDVAAHQQRVGLYNYLVGPLRRPTPGAKDAPFLVLIRPTQWRDFTPEDRVLLQAVCQLWGRGLVKAELICELRRENASLKGKTPPPLLLGASVVMDDLRERAARAAGVNATVLLEGETGSGKEVVAQFIHERSPWRLGPFVKAK